MLEQFDFDHLRNLTVGTVDYVSPNEIKVVLDLSAPHNTAINTGVPTLFPRINGFVLIPNENGALVGLISWLGVEHSQYPKRKGYKDFDLIDLPFPLRKMSITPMGTLKQRGKIEKKEYKLERGVYSFPSVGDSVILPTDIQLKSIVENKEKNALVKIGTAPIASNADVKINPDKLFGRHVAILGNTGSGKSCSVAGVIRWSLEAASKDLDDGQDLNARFIILDPNGEYTNAFDDIKCEVKRFKVEISKEEGEIFKDLKVPAWLWNSSEWGSFSNASSRTQKPLLKRALRDLRSGSVEDVDEFKTKVRSYFSSCLVTIKIDKKVGAQAFKSDATKFGKKLASIARDANFFALKTEDDTRAALENLAQEINVIAQTRYKTFQKGVETIEYYEAFEIEQVETAIGLIEEVLEPLGGVLTYTGPNEDTPIPFQVADLPDHIEHLGQEQGVSQFIDFLIMRMRTMLAETRMNSIVGEYEDITLESWLSDYVNGISIIDLSLVPSEITHLVVSVISRLVFESLQRYRRTNKSLLPTNIVMEEAHNFIKRYNDSSDEISASQLCTESFEKIAREGRKFGLSLTLSSQRPSELSPTVLSQCNTFLLHRIVNDRDQELVKRLVPDNIGGLLNELPILPTRKAILLGWATPLPILVEINNLEEAYRPQSKDPDFWDVWTRRKEREVDWKTMADEWQDVEHDSGVEEIPEVPQEQIASKQEPTSEDEDDNDDLPF
ncbi:ATP-binding protein [Flagellimonas sp.]|uniref:ATP-binding protein n=1 Tax=Flagellimonas sp. TaxID=2058762 RepID=UPI003BAB5163